MEQVKIMNFEQDFEKLYCLPEKEPADPDKVVMVIETTNYRIEIEIG